MDTNQTCVEETDVAAVEYIWRLSIALFLLMWSGTFSGLTLGLLGLDLTGLDIIIKGDPTSDESQYAKKIYPLRKDGNLLLCTLLLGNVAVNSMLSILLADILSGEVGFAVSTVFIVIFGEIIPQAYFSRYALWVGAKAVPVVKVLIIVMYVFTKPIAMVLDYALGEELGTVHTRRQLEEVIKFHGQQNLLDNEEVGMMKGALAYAKKKVSDVMTKRGDVFMLPVTQTLDFNTISTIFRRGFSRIPVYDSSKNNVVGILFTKDLILLDPEDNVSIRNVLHFFSRTVMKVREENTLSEVLNLFKSGRCHLAIVVSAQDSKVSEMHDPVFVVSGIITIEDIIEDILQTEISDETDEDVATKRNKNAKRDMFDVQRLALLDPHKAEEKLTEQEIKVIATHLLHNVDVFKKARAEGKPLEQEDVEKLLKLSKILSVRPSSPAQRDRSDSDRRRQDKKNGLKLYRRGRATNICTFIIEGKVSVVVGDEGFRSELGKFEILGRKSLTSFPSTQYVPDFTATTLSAESVCRVLRIYASDFYNILNPSEADIPRRRLSGEDEARSLASSVNNERSRPASLAMSSVTASSKVRDIDENESIGRGFTALEIDDSSVRGDDSR